MTYDGTLKKSSTVHTVIPDLQKNFLIFPSWVNMSMLYKMLLYDEIHIFLIAC